MELATTAPLTGRDPGLGLALRACFKETQYELLKLLRERSFTLSIVGFPLVFFFLFGISNRNVMFHGYTVARYLVASYSCFGAMGAAFFGIGAGMAYERGLGWLELKRAGPMPAPAYLLSKLVASIVFGIAIALLLIGIGSAATDMHITLLEGLHLLFVIAGGVLAFASMGVMAGLLMPANSAAGLINFIYLPLSLCGGLWMPLEALPHWLQAFAHVLPSYYFSRLALHALGYFHESETAAWLILIAYAAVFTVASGYILRTQDSRK